MNDPKAAPAVDPQAAALNAAAAALDAQAEPAAIDPATGQAPAPIDYQGEASMLLDLAVTATGQFWPCVPTIWTKEKRAAVAEAAAPVMEKYGFTLGDFFGAYQAEIGLVMVAGPLVIATLDAVKDEKLSQLKAAKAGQGADTDAPTEPAGDPLAP